MFAIFFSGCIGIMGKPRGVAFRYTWGRGYSFCARDRYRALKSRECGQD